MISWPVGRLVGGTRGGDKKERCELEARWIQGGEREGAESLLETDPSEFERK